MIRNPFSLEKMACQGRKGVVVYRSKLHATLKRNFKVMPAAVWLKLLPQHVPTTTSRLGHVFIKPRVEISSTKFGSDCRNR